jgi:hypothetical protein
VERVGQVAGPDRRAVERVTAEPSRILRPAEEQVAAAEGVVHPYGVAGDLPRREVLRELLAFPESAQALVVFAELPQDPGAGGDGPWQREHGIGRPERGNAVIDPEARQSPVSPEEKEQTGSPVGHADDVRVLRRLGELNPLERVPGGLVEPAQLGEAPREKDAIIHGRRGESSERLGSPVGGQHREVVGGELDDPLVVASMIVRLFQNIGGEEAEFQIADPLGDLPSAGAVGERLVKLADQRVSHRHERADLAAPAVVVQLLGERVGLAQAFEDVPVLTELVQRRPQLQANVEALLQRGVISGQVLERSERAREARHRLPFCEPIERRPPRAAEMEDGLAPHLALEGMQTEREVVRLQIAGVDDLERFGHAAVQRLAARPEDLA